MVTLAYEDTEPFDEVPDDDFRWQELASCYRVAYLYPDQNDNPFFKEGRGQTYPKARKYCAGCPVVVDCLVDGLDTEVGFRGGCSPIERQQIRMAMLQGERLEDAVEAIWSVHRANPKAGEVPDSKVWDEWIT